MTLQMQKNVFFYASDKHRMSSGETQVTEAEASRCGGNLQMLVTKPSEWSILVNMHMGNYKMLVVLFKVFSTFFYLKTQHLERLLVNTY